MMMRSLVCVFTAMAVGGCAISPQLFYAKREKFSDYEICTAWADAAKGTNTSFTYDVSREAAQRGYDGPGCTALIREQQGNAAALLVGVLVVAGAAAVATRGGSGGPFVPTDNQWDWDLQNSDQGVPVWVCRGVQTGQYAELWRCAGLAKTDLRWPGLGR